MTTPEEPEEPEWLSVDVIREEVEVERDLQSKLGDTSDSRAGVVLGFSGALAALALNTKTLLALPGALVAVGAAVAATLVIWPQRADTLDPVGLTEYYATEPPNETKKQVLQRRVHDYKTNVCWVKKKQTRLRVAMALLVTAIGFVVIGVALRLYMNTHGH